MAENTPLHRLAQIMGHDIAKQINTDADSFTSYGEREATKYEHLEEIRKDYGYQTFTLNEYRSLCKHLFKHAMTNGNPLHLIQISLEDLRKRKIILPSMATIERAVWRHVKEQKKKYLNFCVVR